MSRGLLNTSKRTETKPDTRQATKRVRPAAASTVPATDVSEAVAPVSVDDLVMRSVNLLRSQDDALREMAYLRRVSKNDIIRAAIACKMREWDSGTNDAFLKDLKLGLIGISD